MYPHVHNNRFTRYRRLVYALCFGSLLVAMVLLISGCGGGSKASVAPQGSPIIQPTNPVLPKTPKAQGTPTKVPTTSGAPVLGSSIGTFVAAFGQPNAQSDASDGTYYFSLNGSGNNDLTVSVDATTHLVSSVSKEAPAAQPWAQDQATAACASFLPTDSVYQREITFSDSQGDPTTVQRVYLSSSLGQQFPAAQFNDEHAKPAQAGTIGLALSYGVTGGTTFSGCTVQVGLQVKQ